MPQIYLGDCASCCGGLSSDFVCADLPDTLTVTVSSPFPVVFTISRGFPGANFWSGFVGATVPPADVCDPSRFGVSLTCNPDGTFTLNPVASYRGTPSVVGISPVSTTPFVLSYDGPESGLCGGTVTFTITA